MRVTLTFAPRLSLTVRVTRLVVPDLTVMVSVLPVPRVVVPDVQVYVAMEPSRSAEAEASSTTRFVVPALRLKVKAAFGAMFGAMA